MAEATVRTGPIRDGLRRLAALPGWLLAAADADRVGAALGEHVPGLVGCEAERFRHDGATWTAWYDLTVDGLGHVMLAGVLHPPGQAPPDRGGEQAPFGDPSWRLRLPELGLDLGVEPPGASLPVVARLTDPEQARLLLEAGLQVREADLSIAACTPRVLRDKPGRCTLRCELDYSAGVDAAGRGWPGSVIVKAYARDEGADAWAGMRALWDSGLPGGGAVSLAEPLAYLPDVRVLVQGLVPEQDTFKDFMRSSLRAGTAEARTRLDAYAAATARGLAALHGSGVRHGGTVTIEDELAEIRQVLADLAVPFGDLPGAATSLLDRVEELAATHPADPAVPTHRSFRPGQVLLNEGRVGFIDFDGLCMAEPALDVALFCATVKDLGMDKRTTRSADPQARLDRVLQLERVCERFLDEYEATAPVSRVRVTLWETLDLLTNVLRCWTKVKPERVAPTMLLLERQLAASGL
ncbi:MAG TPA: phosphotransferase [Actinomycetes bacterium]|nr:phosphotransferase [Actinomycetes bacterium]